MPGLLHHIMYYMCPNTSTSHIYWHQRCCCYPTLLWIEPTFQATFCVLNSSGGLVNHPFTFFVMPCLVFLYVVPVIMLFSTYYSMCITNSRAQLVGLVWSIRRAVHPSFNPPTQPPPVITRPRHSQHYSLFKVLFHLFFLFLFPLSFSCDFLRFLVGCCALSEPYVLYVYPSMCAIQSSNFSTSVRAPYTVCKYSDRRMIPRAIIVTCCGAINQIFRQRTARHRSCLTSCHLSGDNVIFCHLVVLSACNLVVWWYCQLVILSSCLVSAAAGIDGEAIKTTAMLMKWSVYDRPNNHCPSMLPI